MNHYLKKISLCLFLVLGLSTAYGQFGIGATMSNDIYNRYSNPRDGLAHRANGSFLLNLGLGPKIWVGGENFSVSFEGQANIGFLGLAIPDYKGLGNLSFPLIAKLNFAGMSGLNKEGRFGLCLGGGVQYNRTELYYVQNSFEERGGTREYFKTYVIHAGYGFGISGFAVQAFVRYGFNPDLDGANSFNFGLQYDFNIPKLKQIDDPASRL